MKLGAEISGKMRSMVELGVIRGRDQSRNQVGRDIREMVESDWWRDQANEGIREIRGSDK